MDPRPGAKLGPPDERLELLYLRAGSEPPGARPRRDGVDITDRPDLWTPYQRMQREAYEARVARYRRDGLL
ncbi:MULTISPECIES: hypothetical protein [unclassified Microbacterium]|uniref:hypothetical protein n=1 Tax=unclassified Microbacterium TaxID=2609290 RepID=UPI00042376AF|nr:hypothetical protein [Microbacterium sp. B24]